MEGRIPRAVAADRETVAEQDREGGRSRGGGGRCGEGGCAREARGGEGGRFPARIGGRRFADERGTARRGPPRGATKRRRRAGCWGGEVGEGEGDSEVETAIISRDWKRLSFDVRRG